MGAIRKEDLDRILKDVEDELARMLTHTVGEPRVYDMLEDIVDHRMRATTYTDPLTGQKFIIPGGSARPVKGGTAWTLPPQAKPNTQGNYVATPGYSIGGSVVKAPAPQPESPPQKGDTWRVVKQYTNPAFTPGREFVVEEVGSEGGYHYGWFTDGHGRCCLHVDKFHEHCQLVARAPSTGAAAAPAKNPNFPHTCSTCGAPSYNGFNKVDCSNASCATHRGMRLP